MKELVYHRMLLPALDRHADKTAFFDGSYAGTYAEHGDRLFRLCRALRERLGLGADDRRHRKQVVILFVETGAINSRIAGKGEDPNEPETIYPTPQL